MALDGATPAFAPGDKAYQNIADAKSPRDSRLRIAFCKRSPNENHVGCGEFGAPVSFAKCVALFSDHVSRVLGTCAKEEVVWVDARRSVAPVADAQPRRYLPDKKGVGNAMGALRPSVRALPGGESAVSVLEQAPGPDKASVHEDCLREKPEHGVRSDMIAFSQVSLQSGSLVRPGCDVSGIALGRVYFTAGG